MPFSRGSSQPRDRTQISRIAGGILFHLNQQGSPRILEWVAYPRGSSQHRNRTGVSCIAGRFFTIWATREAPNFSSGGDGTDSRWRWFIGQPRRETSPGPQVCFRTRNLQHPGNHFLLFLNRVFFLFDSSLAKNEEGLDHLRKASFYFLTIPFHRLPLLHFEWRSWEYLVLALKIVSSDMLIS